MRLVAPAKVNLFLHVTGRRNDGYHTLDSLITFAEMGDVLSVTASNELSLSVSGPMAASLKEPPEKNLILKAARLLQSHTKVKKGAAFVLEKNMPLGAGLGGGSSDAATALLLLKDLWKLPTPPQELEELALGLGADIPVCLRRKTAVIEDIGKIARTLSIPPLYAVFVHPGVALSTRDVFAGYKKSFRKTYPLPAGNIISQEALLTILAETHNDLEEAAVSALPEISSVLDGLKREEGCLFARMSGSGSACFGLYKDSSAAEKAANHLRAHTADKKQAWWVVPTRLGIS